MTLHPAFFALVVTVFFAALAGTAAYSFQRMRRPKDEVAIEAMMARLVAVDRENVAAVAADYSEAEQGIANGSALEDWQVWDLIGGLEGLQAMAANCDVLIELASHVQQWYPEALPVAEQLRLNAREIQWHLQRLKGAQSRGNLQSAFPDYAQRATAIYFDMTRHVLALYEATQAPGWTTLQSAL